MFVSYPREFAELAEELSASNPTSVGEEDPFVPEFFVCHCSEQTPPQFSNWSQDRQRSFLGQKIGASRAVVVLWCHDYAHSAWCLHELRTAVTAGRPLVVVRLDATVVPRAIHEALQSADVVPPTQPRVPVVSVSASAADPRTAEQEIRCALGSSAGASPGPGNARSSLRVHPRDLEIDPAYSLFSTPGGSHFRGGSLSASMHRWANRLRPLLLALGAQTVLYALGAPRLGVGTGRHVLALAYGLAVSSTLLGSMVLSVRAASIAATLSMLGVAAWSMWHESPSRDAVAFVASVATLFTSAATVGLLFGFTQESTPRLHHLRLRRHRLPALATLAVAASIAVALLALPGESLTAIAILRTELGLPSQFGLPVGDAAQSLASGAIVGLLLGASAGVLVYRRRLGSLRQSEATTDRRAAVLAVIAVIGLGLFGIVVALASVGDWLPPWPGASGAYAGVQLGLIGTSAVALPLVTIRVGSSTAGVQAWSYVALVVSTTVITLMVSRLPFGADRLAIGMPIGTGAATGLAAGIVTAFILGRLSKPPRRNPTSSVRLAMASSWLAHLPIVLPFLGDDHSVVPEQPPNTDIIVSAVPERRQTDSTGPAGDSTASASRRGDTPFHLRVSTFGKYVVEVATGYDVTAQVTFHGSKDERAVVTSSVSGAPCIRRNRGPQRGPCVVRASDQHPVTITVTGPDKPFWGPHVVETGWYPSPMYLRFEDSWGDQDANEPVVELTASRVHPDPGGGLD